MGTEIEIKSEREREGGADRQSRRYTFLHTYRQMDSD
jgi:hypothetical protein